MPSPAIRIVTRADDLGSYHSANVAIMDAFKKGILRNSSIIVPAGHFDEAAEMFRHEKDFCLGLHAALTCEWNNVRWKPLLPASRKACFVDAEGAMHKTTQAIQDSGKVRFAEILAEIQAQLNKARKAKLDIKYIDSHMGFTWLFEGTDDSNRFSEPMARWIEKEGLINAAGGNDLPLKRLGRPANPSADRIADLASVIRSTEPGTYLMVSHPMYGTHADVQPACYGKAKPGEIAAQRDIERRMFMDPAIVQACKEKNVQPIRYTEM
jgi:chitin disaccharide deacetylase